MDSEVFTTIGKAGGNAAFNRKQSAVLSLALIGLDPHSIVGG